jgi:microcystin degradation protein MlrC
MLDCADAMVAFRTYPHIDYVETGTLTAEALRRRLEVGRLEPTCHVRLPFLIPINSQNTTFGKPKEIYDRLRQIDADLGTLSSFCMGFPSSDFAECAPMIWSIGARADESVALIEAVASEPTQWQLHVYEADESVLEAVRLGQETDRPIIIADTQDNPGIGGTASTTGMLHGLRKAEAGKIFPSRVALGVMKDPGFVAQAVAAGVGGRFRGALGEQSMLWDGPSDPPVEGDFTVCAISDGRVTFKGPKMTGFLAELGPSVCVEIEGIKIVVASGKIGAQDRELFRFVGVEPERMKIIVLKSSNHFRADFSPLVEDERKHILTAKARGAMAVDPGDLPWKKLPDSIRRRP